MLFCYLKKVNPLLFSKVNKARASPFSFLLLLSFLAFSFSSCDYSDSNKINNLKNSCKQFSKDIDVRNAWEKQAWPESQVSEIDRLISVGKEMDIHMSQEEKKIQQIYKKQKSIFNEIDDDLKETEESLEKLKDSIYKFNKREDFKSYIYARKKELQESFLNGDLKANEFYKKLIKQKA